MCLLSCQSALHERVEADRVKPHVTSSARVHHGFAAYAAAGSWRCRWWPVVEDARASYGRQQQRNCMAAKEGGQYGAGWLAQNGGSCGIVHTGTWRCDGASGWATQGRRGALCPAGESVGGKVLGSARTSCQLLTVSLGSITEGVSVDSVPRSVIGIWRSSCHCTRDWLAVKRSQGRSDEKAFRRHICTGIWHHWCGIAVQFVSPPGIARGGGWWAAAAEG